MSTKGRRRKNTINPYKQIIKYKRDNTLVKEERDKNYHSTYQAEIIAVFDSNVPYVRKTEKNYSTKRNIQEAKNESKKNR